MMVMRRSARRFFSSRVPSVFDSALKRKQREYAASRDDAAEFDYLRTEVAKRVVDRIEDIQREFPYMLDIGCHSGHVYGETRFSAREEMCVVFFSWLAVT